MAFDSNEEIDGLIERGIDLMSSEIKNLEEAQKDKALSKSQLDNLIELLKTLVIIRKDWRLSRVDGEKPITDEQYKDAIAKEYNKLFGVK